MQRAWVQSLGQEDSLEEETATHTSILGNPKDREAWWDTVHGVAKRQDLEQHGIYSTFIKKDDPFPNTLYCYALISW